MTTPRKRDLTRPGRAATWRKWNVAFQVVVMPLLAVIVWPYVPAVSVYLVTHAALALIGWLYFKAEDDGRRDDARRLQVLLYIGVIVLVASIIGIFATAILG